MLTSLDIENKKFGKQIMNGYSVEEVDDFLDEVGVEFAKTLSFVYKKTFSTPLAMNTYKTKETNKAVM